MWNIARDMTLAFLSGYLSKQTDKYVARVSAPSWRTFARYIARSTARIPTFILTQHDLQNDIEDRSKLSLIAYVLSATAFGVGLVTAWFLCKDE